MECLNCGTVVEENAKFCPNCGKKFEEVKEEVEQMEVSEKVEQVNTSNTNDTRLIEICSYLGLLVLIPIIKMNESDSIRFHANQGLVLLIANTLFNIVTGFLSVIFMWSDIFKLLIAIIQMVVSIGMFALAVIGIVNAYQGKKQDLPIIGHFSIL